MTSPMKLSIENSYRDREVEFMLRCAWAVLDAADGENMRVFTALGKLIVGVLLHRFKLFVGSKSILRVSSLESTLAPASIIE